MDLKAKVKELPSLPGIYMMKDSLDSVIYVGKSKNLKSRVGSYFQNSKSHPPKVVKLVKNIKDFEYKLTDTEFEAFMLECKLIKEIKPIYNKLMKSPKSYSYIKIKISEQYPDIEISSEVNKDDGNLYFGPYTSKNTVAKALKGIRECCKILCSNSSRKASSCLNYSLGLCIGMCLNGASQKQYFDTVHKIILLLNGTDKGILQEMEHRMTTASEKFDFENAAKYRDYISAVNYLLDKVKVVKFTEENKNIALLERLSDATFKFFLVKGDKVLFGQKYDLGNSNLEKLKSTLKSIILTHFNDESLKNPIKIGKEDVDEAQIIYTYLKSKASGCRNVVISKKWLNTSNNINIDKAINKLLLDITP